MSVQPTAPKLIPQPDWLAPLLHQCSQPHLEQLLQKAGCRCQRLRKLPPATILACTLAYQELVWRDIKETLLAGAAVALRSHQPELIRQEVWALLTVHNLLRGLMHQAASQRSGDPLGLSYRRCWRVLRRQLLQPVEEGSVWYACLLDG
ncbi:MAG TPA: hypothetical protein VN688_16080, partial [Gemmataceae bacterium]|nr:hypothetical protein [Gemmataceae bacterium]